MQMTKQNLYAHMDDHVKNAVAYFWNTRHAQQVKQLQAGTSDQGNRGNVTGGKQLDGFVDLVKQALLLYGLPGECIFTNSALELPGYYRPNKKWDLLAVYDNHLVAAVEFKSQVGPSFGNNFNNRTEEAMGSALDLWTAYREGVFGAQIEPWLGYIMLLEECPRSITPVASLSPHFPIMEEFIGASYKERYKIFCKKLMLERQYSAACLITTRRDTNDLGNYKIPDGCLSFSDFIASLTARIDAAVRGNML